MENKLDITLANATSCTGCGLCAAVCANDAISIRLDKLHYFPFVDKDKCVGCHLCEKSCSELNPVKKNSVIKCYAGKSMDQDLYFQSSSGGAASELYRFALSNGYAIVGSDYDEKLVVRSRITTSEKDISKFRGSKYVHNFCDKGVYREIKSLLKVGGKVLFIGLPCQCAAVSKYCDKYSDNLILVDLLCHGGTSPQLFQEHLHKIVDGNGVANIQFRGGGRDYYMTIYDKMGYVTYSQDMRLDDFFCAFVDHVALRPSCYQCRYAEPSRCSDITIGDFWGLDNGFALEKGFDNGVSLLLTHTAKGEQILQRLIRKSLVLFERQIQEAINGNDTLKGSTQKPNFLKWYSILFCSLGFHKTMVLLNANIRHAKIRDVVLSFARLFKPIMSLEFEQKLKRIKRRFL